MAPPNEVLTTGQVAKICNVAPRTVSKWFDSGQLPGYRIPGSKDRRIPVEQLIRFMKAHSIPLNGLDGNRSRVLVVDQDPSFASAMVRALESKGYRAASGDSVLAAGLAVERLRPHVILLDVDLPRLDLGEWCRVLRMHHDLHGTRLIGLGRDLTHERGRALLQQGLHGFLEKPFAAESLQGLLQDELLLVH